jgi:hypothetical protein
MSNLVQLINAMDEAIATIPRLSELGPAIDDGSTVYFANAIELLALIEQHPGHLERLSTQLTGCVLGPRRLEDPS